MFVLWLLSTCLLFKTISLKTSLCREKIAELVPQFWGLWRQPLSWDVVSPEMLLFSNIIHGVIPRSTNRFYKMRSDLCQLEVDQNFFTLRRKVFISCYLRNLCSYVFIDSLQDGASLGWEPWFICGAELWKKASNLPWGERLFKGSRQSC